MEQGSQARPPGGPACKAETPAVMGPTRRRAAKITTEHHIWATILVAEGFG